MNRIIGYKVVSRDRYGVTNDCCDATTFSKADHLAQQLRSRAPWQTFLLVEVFAN